MVKQPPQNLNKIKIRPLIKPVLEIQYQLQKKIHKKNCPETQPLMHRTANLNIMSSKKLHSQTNYHFFFLTRLLIVTKRIALPDLYSGLL